MQEKQQEACRHMEALEQELADKETLWLEEKGRLESRLEDLSLSKQRFLLEVEDRVRKDRIHQDRQARERGLKGMKACAKRWKLQSLSGHLRVWRERVMLEAAHSAGMDPIRHASEVLGEVGHLIQNNEGAQGERATAMSHKALERLEQALHIVKRELASDPENAILASQLSQLEAQIAAQGLLVELEASRAEAKDYREMQHAAQNRFEDELESLRRCQDEDLATTRAERREALGRQAEAEGDLRRLEIEIEKKQDLQLRAEKGKAVAEREAALASKEAQAATEKVTDLEAQLRRAVEAAELVTIRSSDSERQCLALRDALDRQGLDQNAAAAEILRRNQRLQECLQDLGWKAISILDSLEALDPDLEGGLAGTLRFKVRSIPDGEGVEGQRLEAALGHLEACLGSLGEDIRSERERHRLELQELERRLRVLSITQRGRPGERYNRLSSSNSSKRGKAASRSRSPPGGGWVRSSTGASSGREGRRSNAYYEERYEGRGGGPYDTYPLSPHHDDSDDGGDGDPKGSIMPLTFVALDTNRDGVIDRREFERGGGMPDKPGRGLAERVRALEDAARRAAVVARD